MHKHGLTFTFIMLFVLIAGPACAQGMDCEQQKQQLEEAMRMMGNLSEEEMQSRLDEVQQICDTHGGNPANAAPTTRQEPAQRDVLAMTELTAEYLAGKWCGVTGQQERGPWVFSANGSYQVGIPAGNGYTMRPGGDSIDHFHNRFDRLESRTADRFVVYRFDRESVFQRGTCQ